jgi:hypothetical protein
MAKWKDQAAQLGGAALKVAGKLGQKVSARVKEAVEGEKGSDQPARQA